MSYFFSRELFLSLRHNHEIYMSVLKKLLFSLVATCAVIIIDASQSSPTLIFVSDSRVKPEEDHRLRQQLRELAELDTELDLNILPAGMPMGVNPAWVNWLQSCVKQRRLEKFELESVKMFTCKGHYPPGYAEARQKFAQDPEFVFFDLLPVNKTQAQQKERIASFSARGETNNALADASSSSQSPAPVSCTFYQAVQLVIKEAEEHAQEYQRKCDTYGINISKFRPIIRRRRSTGCLIALPL